MLLEGVKVTEECGDVFGIEERDETVVYDFTIRSYFDIFVERDVIEAVDCIETIDRLFDGVFYDVLILPHLYDLFFEEEFAATPCGLLYFLDAGDGLAEVTQGWNFSHVRFGDGNFRGKDDVFIISD